MDFRTGAVEVNDQTKELRPDWRIAKRLYDLRGLEAARDWLSVPLVDLRANGYENVIRKPGAREHWVHVPFLDAVYMIPFMLGSAEEAETEDEEPILTHLAVRITKLDGDFDEDEGQRVTFNKKFWVGAALPVCIAGDFQGDLIDSRAIDGTHPKSEGSLPIVGDLLLSIYLHTPGARFARMKGLTGKPIGKNYWGWLAHLPITLQGDRPEPVVWSAAWDKLFRSHAMTNVLFENLIGAVDSMLVYLWETDDHYFEVCYDVSKIPERRRKKMEASNERFPWLDPRKPHIVVIDPKKRRVKKAPQGGTHASPYPHPRKGHWRTYRHPKFTNLQGQRRRIKPAYVGDREFVHAGSVYKVIDVVPPTLQGEDET
jgi:hypothetical protein